jgi:hypothetical protein
MQKLWKLWAKSLGAKASSCDKEADKVAIIRTLIFLSYFITNSFIIANAIRHWEKQPVTIIELSIKENTPHFPRYNKTGPIEVYCHESNFPKEFI